MDRMARTVMMKVPPQATAARLARWIKTPVKAMYPERAGFCRVTLLQRLSGVGYPVEESVLKKRFAGYRCVQAVSHGIKRYRLSSAEEVFELYARDGLLYICTFDGHAAVAGLTNDFASALERAYEAYRVMLDIDKL